MLSFFARDVLDGILDLIESVSEGFPTGGTTSIFPFLTFHFLNGNIPLVPAYGVYVS